jgi:phosphoserine phosphatase/putative flippase GtrA
MNVYDFDNTIYDGDSSLDFFLFVLGKKPYLVFLLPRQMWGTVKYMIHIHSKERMKEDFFSFIKYVPAEAMAVQFWERHYKKIKQWYLRQKQDADVIISASPEFLLSPLVHDRLQVALIASVIDPHTVRYIGKNCHGEEKVKRFTELYGEETIENFYTDSLSDIPLVQKAVRSFLVKGADCIPWQMYKPSLIAKIKATWLTKNFILFVFCGGMGTLTNFVFSLLISAKLNASVSYICGYAISLFVAYSLNAKLIFHHTLDFTAFLKFIVSYIPNFLILFTFVLIFLNIFGWNKVMVYALAGLLGLPITFILVKLLVFKRMRE